MKIFSKLQNRFLSKKRQQEIEDREYQRMVKIFNQILKDHFETTGADPSEILQSAKEYHNSLRSQITESLIASGETASEATKIIDHFLYFMIQEVIDDQITPRDQITEALIKFGKTADEATEIVRKFSFLTTFIIELKRLAKDN